jgi:hypothetical protein
VSLSGFWDKWIEDFKEALKNKRAYIAVGSDVKQEVRQYIK